MINGPRGEVALDIGPQTFKLCLTMRALGEIETVLEVQICATC